MIHKRCRCQCLFNKRTFCVFAARTLVGHSHITDNLQFCRNVFQFLKDYFFSNRTQSRITVITILFLFGCFTEDFPDRQILDDFLPFSLRVVTDITFDFFGNRFWNGCIRFNFRLIKEGKLSVNLFWSLFSLS